jgi:hypothetical protein
MQARDLAERVMFGGGMPEIVLDDDDSWGLAPSGRYEKELAEAVALVVDQGDETLWPEATRWFRKLGEEDKQRVGELVYQAAIRCSVQ